MYKLVTQKFKMAIVYTLKTEVNIFLSSALKDTTWVEAYCTVMDWTFAVHPLPIKRNSYVEALPHNVTIIGDGPLRK